MQTEDTEMPRIPSSPNELIHNVLEGNAKDVFEGYEDYSPMMQAQARLLIGMVMNGQLHDETFRDILGLTYWFWRECNQARFKPLTQEALSDTLPKVVRSAQIDQFVNTSLVALNALPGLLEDTYHFENED